MHALIRAQRGSRRPGRLVAMLALILTLLAAANPAGASPSPSAAPTPAATAGGSSGSAGSGSATFGIGPASGTGLDGRSTLNYSASPGGQSADHVAIENYATSPVTLQVYASDAENGADGSFGLLPRSAPGSGASTWLAIRTPSGTNDITLGARSILVLPITMKVPLSASPGDHTAGIVVSLTSKIKGTSGQDVNFEQRVGLRAFIRVSGPIHPQLSIEKLSASYTGTLNPLGKGDVTVSWTVKNTGNVNLGGSLQLQVDGIFGKAGPAPKLPTVPVLLPGSALVMKTTVRGVWPQILLHGKVTVTPIAPPTDDDPGLKAASTSVAFWAVPWATLAMILLVGLLIAAVIWQRRRSARKPKGGRHGPPPKGRVREPVPA